MKDKEMIAEMTKDLERIEKEVYGVIIKETQAYIKEHHRYNSKEDYSLAHIKTVHERTVEEMIKLGYRKLPEDSVMLSREEYNKLITPRLFISKTHLNNKDLIDELNRVGNYGIIGKVSGSVELLPTRAEIEKETAENILKDFANAFPKVKGISSSHAKINRYIEEYAKQLDVKIKNF